MLEFHIAEGKSRKETRWKNKRYEWPDLVERLRNTHRTAETLDEYERAKKDRQDEIKDIGGFVGGILTSGRRKSENVTSRQLITLDVDFGDPSKDVWEAFCMVYGNLALRYSTHKHRPEKPRYRIVIPLETPVFPEEYVAIARKIAGSLDIEQFDDSTYQPERLMYWPSTSKDGEYLFDVCEGPVMRGADILAEYIDWTDSSQWPISSRHKEAIRTGMSKQEDPTEKNGIIGAFCRTYTIQEALSEFLSDVYSPTDEENRYSYMAGTTSSGLVLYDDKFAYSHHGSDPAFQKLSNAFDLVRIHKFGKKDEDARIGTPINKMPSYLAMSDFATTLAPVRKLMHEERSEEAMADFAGIEAAEIEQVEETDNDWVTKLTVNADGSKEATIPNIVTILRNDPLLKNKMYFDEFAIREAVKGSLPWRPKSKTAPYLTDADLAGLRFYLEATYGISSKAKTEDALTVVLQENTTHPVREYLSSVKWDGKPRLDTVFIDYLGVEDTELNRIFARRSLVACVARIFNPGCKFEYVLVLAGEEGMYKSTILQKLGGEWFSDSLRDLKGNQALEQLQGSWIIELPELSGFKKADDEMIKHFLGIRTDKFRVAYGRRTEQFPRQLVFFGTTNREQFLRNADGNRRFWIQTVNRSAVKKSVMEDLTTEEVAQIWAEAVYKFKKGEPIYLEREYEIRAKAIQDQHTEEDDRAGLVRQYLEMPIPAQWETMSKYQRLDYLSGNPVTDGMGDPIEFTDMKQRERVCIPEIWVDVFNGSMKDLTMVNTKMIRDILNKMPDWEQYPHRTTFKGYGSQRGYKRVVKQKDFEDLSTTSLEDLKLL